MPHQIRSTDAIFHLSCLIHQAIEPQQDPDYTMPESFVLDEDGDELIDNDFVRTLTAFP